MSSHIACSFALALVACGNDIEHKVLTEDEESALAELSPLPDVPPADPTNAVGDHPRAALLGQMLFFDKSYSGPLAIGDNGTNGGVGAAGTTGKVSCHSCHGVGSAHLDDQRSKPNNVSLGADYGSRNALGLVNSAHYRWTNWGGRFDSQWSLALAVAENPKIMNSTRLQVAHLLYDKYRAEYEAVFPALDPVIGDLATIPAIGKPGTPAYDTLSPAHKAIVDTAFVNYGKALQAYVRRLVSTDAPFDRFAAGERRAISATAIRGFKVFLESGCKTCHAGPNFSDGEFHALALPQTGPHVPSADLGRYQDVPPLLASPFNSDGVWSDRRDTQMLAGLAQGEEHRGAFRTKSLRDVARSAPYMHTGQLATLEDVVAFYARGGGDSAIAGHPKDPLLACLELDPIDRAALVAFLETLTSEPLPAHILADLSK